MKTSSSVHTKGPCSVVRAWALGAVVLAVTVPCGCLSFWPAPDTTSASAASEQGESEAVKDPVTWPYGGFASATPSDYAAENKRPEPELQQLEFIWTRLDELQAEGRAPCTEFVRKVQGAFGTARGNVKREWREAVGLLERLVHIRLRQLELPPSERTQFEEQLTAQLELLRDQLQTFRNLPEDADQRTRLIPLLQEGVLKTLRAIGLLEGVSADQAGRFIIFLVNVAC